MRRLVLLLLLSILAPTARAETEVLATEGKGRLVRQDGQLVLYLKGTPYEMGFQHGKLMKDVARRNVDAILDNKAELGRSTEYKAYRLMRPLMHLRLRPHVPRRFKQEMRGLADGAGIDYDDVEASNLFPEAFHCTGIALMGDATKDGSLYHVRILDYLTEAGLQDTALTIIHEPDGKNRWVNVGFAGFLGSVTGMNDKQVTIGEMGGRGLFYWNGMPMTFLVRDALERANTLDEAVEIFRTTKRTCEYYYVISDAKTPDARGIWATPRDFEVIGPGQRYGFVKAENPRGGAADGKSFLRDDKLQIGPHRILLKDKEEGVEAFIAIQPKDTVILSGYDRYQHFIDRLLPHYGQITERELMEDVKRPVSMKSNLHVAIFHPSTLEVWVAVAAEDGSPACDQPYHRFSLAPLEAAAPKAETKPAGR